MNEKTEQRMSRKGWKNILVAFVKSRGFPVLVNTLVVGSILTYALLSAVPR